LQKHFTDGVCFVSLASLGDPSLVLETIARALGIISKGSNALPPMLSTFLRGKRLLLVLDNFEHLTSAAPDVAALLAACGGVQVLATSRAVLRLQGERLFALTPLALPEEAEGGSPEMIALSPAVALFVQRAQGVKPEFVLTSENAATVAKICRRLDGLPLALELSASRIKVLSPRALLARLERRLHVLTGGARDLPGRHQTMRATIAWSYELLEESGQALFRRLAVFVSGCTLDAAEAVCYGPDVREGAALEELESLLDRSLLRAVEQAGGEPRFQMLETIREYGLECLTASGEAEVIQRSHAKHFLALAEAAEPELWGAEQATWLACLEADVDNLRAALRWAVEVGDLELGLRLGGALWRFWRVHGRSHEGLAVLGELLAHRRSSRCMEVSDPIRAKALSGAGTLAAHVGDFIQATTLLEESMALYRVLDDRPGLAGALVGWGAAIYWQGAHERATVVLEEGIALYRDLGDRQRLPEALHYLGMIMLAQGNLDQATALIEESMAVCKEQEDRAGLQLALSYLAVVARVQGNLDRAMTLEEEGLALAREMGDIVGIAQQLNNLGGVAILKGDLERARASYAEGLALPWDKRNLWGVAFYLEGAAGVAAALGQAAQAATLLGAAEALHEAVNAPAPPSERDLLGRTIALIRDALDEEILAAAWAAGRILPVEQAIAAARELVSPARGCLTKDD
ncbi:MAG: ATP-binding protein, partial [Chloroflexota bacterium]